MNTRLKLHHSEYSNYKHREMRFYAGLHGIGYTVIENHTKCYYTATERQKNIFLHMGNLFYAIRRTKDGYSVSVTKDGEFYRVRRYNENCVRHGMQENYDVATESWHKFYCSNGHIVKK